MAAAAAPPAHPDSIPSSNSNSSSFNHPPPSSSSSSKVPTPFIRVRIVETDFYCAPPVPGLDIAQSRHLNLPLARVPVIRIFGITPEGQKTCVHVHGVEPYFYVLRPPRFAKRKDGDDGGGGGGNGGDDKRDLIQLAECIDAAVQQSTGGRVQRQVADIVEVQGTQYYGFHTRTDSFLKISLCNPSMKQVIATMLQQGVVMGTSFQPFESHIPYVLQFFIDFNLHGMNFIDLASVRFRRPLPPVRSFAKQESLRFSSNIFIFIFFPPPIQRPAKIGPFAKAVSTTA